MDLSQRVIEHVPGKVESLDSFESTIFVGSSDGSLLLYRVEVLANGRFESSLDIKKNLGRRPVDQVLLLFSFFFFFFFS
jgi:hypothetical protein